MGSAEESYCTRGMDPAPEVSRTTIPMAGLLVDVYGLSELPPPGTPITCLWLLHPRTRTRARMQDIASRTLSAWHASSPSSEGSRGLVALAFDMPNHGTRLVSKEANLAWDKGNRNHAMDMAGMVKGAKGDMAALMDLVGGYIGRAEDVDAHVGLGWSLGGHAIWQGWLAEERLDAAVVVVGCPDFVGLMCDRAKTSELDCGSEFLGSKYFPKDLITACHSHDPKTFMFGTEPLPQLPLLAKEQTRLKSLFDERIKEKKLLLCSGADDKLVPYKNSQPLLDILKDAVQGWYGDGKVSVDDRVYEGVGHAFSKDMVVDAVRFLVDVVAEGPRSKTHKAKI